MVCVGAVELGGTRVSVTAGHDPADRADPVEIPTTTPSETLKAVIEALARMRRDGWPIERVGVACFGPLGVDPARAGYGRIGPTPKPGWAGAEVAATLAEGLAVPVVVDTDVNGAALGEGLWGAARGCGSHAYITVGTGVGVGLVIGGRPVHGLAHPEGGHLRVRRHAIDDFPGCCPWHGDCLEGLICGPALKRRLGCGAETASEDDPVFRLAGTYLGEACAALTLIASPERIVIGGGVGRRRAVLEAAREAMRLSLNGYVAELDADGEVARRLVSPGLGSLSGLYGAMALAMEEKRGLQTFA